MGDDLLSRLRAEPFYAGQIYKVAALQGREADVGVFSPEEGDVLSDVLRAAGVSFLYDHQQKALKRIVQQQDCILATSEGSGRSTIADIAACYRVLSHSDTVLLLTPDAISAEHRLHSCRQALLQMGFDYAVTVTSLSERDHSEFESLPEIAVATPAQLVRMFEGQNTRVLDEAYWACLNFIIAEDIHEYVGIYGSNVAALFRCINVLLGRQGCEPSILASSADYSNLLDFTSRLVDRQISPDSLIRTDGASRTRKTLVFWNAPLIRDREGDQEFRRKDIVEDLRDLVEYLSNYDALAADTGRRFCFLIDKSGSMDEELAWAGETRFSTVVRRIAHDVGEKLKTSVFRPHDTLEICTFDTQLHQEMEAVRIDDKLESLEEDIGDVLGKIEPRGGTELSKALLELLRKASSNGREEAASRLVLFVYSDGECSVPAEDALAIHTEIERSALSGLLIDIIYISLGSDPDPSVSSLVKSVGGRICTIAAEADEGLRPFDLWAKPLARRRPVVVSCQNDAVSLEDLSNIGSVSRPVLLHPRITTPVMTEEATLDAGSIADTSDITNCQYLVLVGWQGSPQILRHYLDHIGKNDSYVFVVGTPDPLSQLMLRQWNQLCEPEKVAQATSAEDKSPFPPPDCLCLVRGDSNIGLRALTYFAHHQPLNLSEAGYIVFGDEATDPDVVRQAVRSTPGLSIDAADQIDVQENAENRTLWKSLQVARTGLDVRVGEDSRVLFSVERSLLLSTFVPGTAIVLNGSRYCVLETDGDTCVLGHASMHNMSVPVCDMHVRGEQEEGKKSVPLSFAGSPSSEFLLARVGGKMKGTKDFSGYRLDASPEHRAFDTAYSFAFDTPAFVLRYDKDMDEPLRCALENLCWTFLRGLIRGEPRSTVAVAAQDDALYFFDMVPGGSGFADAVRANDAGVLREALRLAFLSLLGCPCEENAAVAQMQIDESGKSQSSGPSGNYDSGCPMCLRAPTKPLGLPEGNCGKRATLEFLGEGNVLSGSNWRERLEEKYSKVSDDARLYTGRSKYDRGYVPQIREILDHKLGIVFTDDQFAKARFTTAKEAAGVGPSTAGWYDSAKNEVLIKPKYNEFAVLDILSHEYAHNWQAAFTEQESLVHVRYDSENIEAPGNIPFLGKLFLEGSAVWIESHAMDYFANRMILREKNLRIGDEYWQGFRVLKYLEETYGIRIVFAFLLNGALPEDIRDLYALYEASGMAGYLIRLGRHAIDEGQLACLGRDFLGRPTDLIRISAYLQDESLKSLPKSGTNKLTKKNAKAVLPKIAVNVLVKEFPRIKKHFEKLGMNGCVVSDKAGEMSLRLACHLHSGAGRQKTSELLDPIVKEILKDM